MLMDFINFLLASSVLEFLSSCRDRVRHDTHSLFNVFLMLDNGSLVILYSRILVACYILGLCATRKNIRFGIRSISS